MCMWALDEALLRYMLLLGGFLGGTHDSEWSPPPGLSVIKYLGLSYCGRSVLLPRENNAPPRHGHRCDTAALLVCLYARLG